MIVQRNTQRSSRVERPTRICIVDGCPEDYAELVQEAPPEVQIEFIPSGREALRAALTRHVDLWLVNVRLADMSGFDLCEMLKARSARAVVYLVTDEYQAADERAAWLRGAALFRAKPAQPAWLERFCPSLKVAEPVAASESKAG